MSNIFSAKNKIQFERHADFSSQFVTARHVDVWCPTNYSLETNQRYPVIYMHDGQNLFDPTTSTLGVTWGVAETITQMIGEKFGGAIVVGIWNSGKGRRNDYMPQKVVEEAFDTEVKADYLAQNGQPVSDNYLRFLVQELKPFIDANYRTLSDQANTLIMGSSMGGLISLYAVCEYPEIFSKAGCLSTHWTIGENAQVDYFGTRLPSPANHKLYFDFGTVGLDANYEPFQRRMDKWLEQAGYVQGENCLTLKFDGEEHSEWAWSKRLAEPLRFLFGLSNNT